MEENENKKKKNRYLNRECHECGEHKLFLVTKIKKKDNIEYSIKYVECESCGFSEKYNDSKRNRKDCKRIDDEIASKTDYRRNRNMKRSYGY